VTSRKLRDVLYTFCIGKSILFVYNRSKREIYVKREYIVQSGDELQAMRMFNLKKPVSKFTGNRIVPFNFVKQENVYSFDYYDGYDAFLRHWEFGRAVIDASGNIPEENMIHLD
jgi:hypothetical protein